MPGSPNELKQIYSFYSELTGFASIIMGSAAVTSMPIDDNPDKYKILTFIHRLKKVFLKAFLFLDQNMKIKYLTKASEKVTSKEVDLK
jgi:hypothetical protein